MPKSHSKECKRESQHRVWKHDLPKHFNSYLCRICKHPHGLRSCRKFRAMNISERLRAVRKHSYCPNCLAHNHSNGTCFSKHGCRHCNKFHHTLLHVHPRLLKDLASSRSRSCSPSSSRSVTSSSKPTTSGLNSGNSPSTPSSKIQKSHSLSSILRQNTAIFLPTIVARIDTSTSYARCLLDSGSAVSRIAKKFVERLRLTTLTMEQETMCPLILKSRLDSEAELECIFRVDNRISMETPTKSLNSPVKQHFRGLFLADPKFYESSGIDIVLGVDVYPKIIREGVFTKPGLPVAQSTIFGWVIYGSSNLS